MTVNFMQDIQLATGNLQDNEVLAAHFIHSVCHWYYDRGRLTFKPGMTVDDCFAQNTSLIREIMTRYYNERKYMICLASVKKGMTMFIEFCRDN